MRNFVKPFSNCSILYESIQNRGRLYMIHRIMWWHQCIKTCRLFHSNTQSWPSSNTCLYTEILSFFNEIRISAIFWLHMLWNSWQTVSQWQTWGTAANTNEQDRKYSLLRVYFEILGLCVYKPKFGSGSKKKFGLFVCVWSKVMALHWFVCVWT